MSAWPGRLSGKRHNIRHRRQSESKVASRPRKQFRNESTFICGTVKKPLGSNVAVAEKSRVLKRISKKDSALQKHLAWLRELQEKNKRFEEEKKAEEERRLERIRLLSAKRRKDAAEAKQIPVTEEGTVATAPTEIQSTSTNPKPAWCQSEEDAHKKAEEAEGNEELALLDFVDNLDFEQYNEDLELQTLMSQVQSRIKDLQKERKKDETRLQTCMDSEQAALRAEALEGEVLVDQLPADPDPDLDVDDTQSIAVSVLSTDSSIKSIHSRKSMAALVSDAKKRMSVQLNPIEEGEKETAMAPPVTITHTDDDGARMAEKKSIAKLAFKNRNPAI